MRHFIGRWAALFCALLGLLLVMPLAAAEAQIVTLESETTRVELLSDAVIRVPIHGRAESLNLAAAAAVCLYASARAHRRGAPTPLP